MRRLLITTIPFLVLAFVVEAAASESVDSRIILPGGPVRLVVSDMDMTLLNLKEHPTLTAQEIEALGRIVERLEGRFYPVTGSQDWLALPKLRNSGILELVPGAMTDGGLKMLLPNGERDGNHTETLLRLAAWPKPERVREVVGNKLANVPALRETIRFQDEEFQDSEGLATRVWIDGRQGKEKALAAYRLFKKEVEGVLGREGFKPVYAYPAFDEIRPFDPADKERPGVYAVDVAIGAKDVAVKAVQELHGVKRIQTAAMGDAGNDGALAKRVAFFVAPGNVRDELLDPHLMDRLGKREGLVHVVVPQNREHTVSRGTFPGLRLVLGMVEPGDPAMHVLTNQRHQLRAHAPYTSAVSTGRASSTGPAAGR